MLELRRDTAQQEVTGNLTDSDLLMFSRLGITGGLLAQARIERVTDEQARGRYGIIGHGDRAGILFPYYDPITDVACLRRSQCVITVRIFVSSGTEPLSISAV